MSPEAAASVISLATDYLAATRAGDGPVSSPLPPAELARRFDEPMPRTGQLLRVVVERVARDVLGDVNRLYHPMYLGHQVSAPLPAAVWMESVTAAVNNSAAVFEMSPAATMIEHQVIRWMCELAGYGPGSGGTMTSGGTEATFTALLSARAAALPDAWEHGVGDRPLVVVCGEHAHYAVSRAVGQLGLGTRNLIAIPSRDWRMDPAALETRLGALASDGARVMAVVATAGSTATGSFDDLDAIGTLCERRGVWLHVDGAHGASALLSPGHRYRVRGIARARSIAWDPHKMMLLPLSAGMLLMRDERDLDAAFAQRAPYLFHGDTGARIVDQGVRSFLCSRRTDALKLWVALLRYGADGIAELYDHLCTMANALYHELARRKTFEVLHEPESNILCFRFTGGALPDDPSLDELNRELRERYNLSGDGWITATTLGGKRVLRVTVMNPRTTVEHVRRLADGLERVARG